MATEGSTGRRLERVPSGIPGFDWITRGGFVRGGVTMIVGRPGTGKTIFANQVCFGHVARGGRAVYVTILAETHACMLAHLRSLDFFTSAPLANDLYYVSGLRTLLDEGVTGLVALLRRVVRDRQATLLVVDGLVAVEQFTSTTIELNRFVVELEAFSNVGQCTTLVLAGHDWSAPQAENTVVDGIITLEDVVDGMRVFRQLQVVKLRGSDYLRGGHVYEISHAGITIHPRLEAFHATPAAIPEVSRDRVSLGVAELDAMLNGGVSAGTMTILLGPTGSGKTSLGLHFLAQGAAAGEAGLYFGLAEMPARLLAKGHNIGLDLAAQVANRSLEVLWQPSVEQPLDVLGDLLLDAVRRRRVRRLLLDGLDGFAATATSPERLRGYFVTLMNELRAQQVTTVITVGAPVLFGAPDEMPYPGIANSVENIISLRAAELRSHLYRLISIVKMYGNQYDSSIREFRITSKGIEVASTFESAEAVLTEIARPAVGPRTRSPGRTTPTERGQ